MAKTIVLYQFFVEEIMLSINYFLILQLCENLVKSSVCYSL